MSTDPPVPDSSPPDQSDRPPPATGVCLNCATPLDGRFCPACGQDHRYRRLKLGHIVTTAIEEIVEIEAPVMRTLVHLTIRPGPMCRDYVEGKRKRYANPLRYAIVIAAMLVFSIEILDIDLAKPFSDAFAQFGAPPTQTEVTVRLTQLVQTYLNVLVLMAMPIIAVLMRLIDRWSGANTAEHLVALLFIYAHLLLAKTIQIVLLPNSMPVNMGMMVVSSAYQAWAFTTFYRRGLWGGVWRTVTIFFIYQTFMFIVSVIGALAIYFGPRLF